MSACNGKKQPSISRFFTPLQPNGHSSPKSDKETLKKLKSAEVNVTEALKRSKSFESNEKSNKKFKAADSHPEEEDLKSTPTKKSLATSPLSDGVRQKLNAFRVMNGDNKDNDSELESKSSPTKTKKSGLKVEKGVKLTPLEQQVVAIKNEHPDILLFVECGYKYRFFGEDAEIASKELNIMCRMDHNFLTGSIPTHRLHVHVRRLVAKGYKVGVVKQTETAALKAIGANKTAPFTRELSALYTRATLIGEDVTPLGGEEADEVSEGTTSSLMIMMETKSSSAKEDSTGIVFLAIQPTTGDIIYDIFDDSPTRMCLWSRLEHIQPVEVVISEGVSSLTRKAIKAVTTRHGDCIRIETFNEEHFEYSTCLKNLCQLFESQEEKIRNVMDLPQSVASCLGATLKYLQEFKLEKIIKTYSSMTKYSSEKQFMKLTGSSLRNLEVLANTSDGTEKGSLFWVLNRTNTKFGARILRQWLIKPLLDGEKIRERQDMIQEFLTSESSVISTLKTLLHKVPDFERAITTIFYKKCSPYEFWLTVSGLSKIYHELSSVSTDAALEDISSQALLSLINSVLKGLSDVRSFSDLIDESSAKGNKKTCLLRDWSKFSQVVSRQKEIEQVEMQLRELKSHIAQVLGMASFNYTTVSGAEYLIEVKNNKLNCVPSSWNKINMTKTCARFRSPQIEKNHTKLMQLREQLQVDCHQAWLEILESFSCNYQEYREAIKCLGTIDAILSLANVAQTNGYCRPDIAQEDGVIEIAGGKHPIVSNLIHGSDQFVANDTSLHLNGKRVMLVTGPNMGGKSCYMRQVASIVLMVQVGSFVPAHSARVSILDAIYTRMGASDEIYGGRSTFMVEVGETADIMKEATANSLVILDELGRGTSTHDGLAIAMAALDFFLNKVKCFTIFVTHYLPLTEFESLYPDVVDNFHMAFIVSDTACEGADVVTFLYQLTLGSAGKSYGLNVAHLANVPQPVLTRASEKSSSLQAICTVRKKKMDNFRKVFCAQQPGKSVLKNL